MKKSIINREINPSENFVKDALTVFIRESAQKMLKAAIEAEMTEFIDIHQFIGTDGKKQVVRNGYLGFIVGKTDFLARGYEIRSHKRFQKHL